MKKILLGGILILRSVKVKFLKKNTELLEGF